MTAGPGQPFLETAQRLSKNWLRPAWTIPEPVGDLARLTAPGI